MSSIAEQRHKHFHPELHNIMRNSGRSVAAGLKPGLKNTALHSNPLKDIPPTPPSRQDNSQAKRERDREKEGNSWNSSEVESHIHNHSCCSVSTKPSQEQGFSYQQVN